MNVELLTKNPGKSLLKVFVQNDEDYKRQRMPEVGSTKTYSDGRKFVFCSSNVNVAAGQVVSAPLPTSELSDSFTAGLIGDTSVVVTSGDLSAVTAGQYAGGVLVITSTAGVATHYSIKTNSAALTNAVTFELIEPLCGNIAATDDCVVVPARYEGVVIGTATSDGVGVAVSTSTAGTSSLTNYFWVQVAGVGSATVGTAAALTRGVKFILGAAGVIEAQSGAGVQAEFGHVVMALAVSDGDNSAVRMCFE